jgi:hypothetical protein
MDFYYSPGATPIDHAIGRQAIHLGPRLVNDSEWGQG